MRKIVHITVIILLLMGLCITEQLLSQSYLDEMENKTSNLLMIVEASDDVNTAEISSHLNNLEDYWRKKENVLCTFVNHKEIEDIGVEINKTQTHISNNDKAQTTESLNLISFYINSYRHFLQISFQNIF